MAEVFKISLSDGGKQEIEGEICLQDEYPELKLFLGYYPCNLKKRCEGNPSCSCFPECAKYKVCEVQTGAAISPKKFETKQAAIDRAISLINHYGRDEFKKRMDILLEQIKEDI